MPLPVASESMSLLRRGKATLLLHGPRECCDWAHLHEVVFEFHVFLPLMHTISCQDQCSMITGPHILSYVH